MVVKLSLSKGTLQGNQWGHHDQQRRREEVVEKKTLLIVLNFWPGDTCMASPDGFIFIMVTTHGNLFIYIATGLGTLRILYFTLDQSHGEKVEEGFPGITLSGFYPQFIEYYLKRVCRIKDWEVIGKRYYWVRSQLFRYIIQLIEWPIKSSIGDLWRRVIWSRPTQSEEAHSLTDSIHRN